MATYLIGDVQGCFDTLQALLQRIGHDPDRDTLIFLGDLVNRGPRSLEVLRFVHGLGSGARTVLGNHDIHLLAAAEGRRKPQPRDTLQAVLDAPDRDILLGWLRQQPLLLEVGDALCVHAGLLPAWSLDEARAMAREAERVLREPDGLAHILTPTPARWTPELNAPARVALTTAVMTRIRMCGAADSPDFAFKRPPEDAPEELQPWFAKPHPSWRTRRLFFGHWAALGYRSLPVGAALDSGAVWGLRLTALCLESGAIVQQDAVDSPAP